jgi:hypothetical protein
MLTRPHLPSLRPLAPLALLAAAFAVALGAVPPRAAVAWVGQAASIEGSWSLGFPNEDPARRQLAAFLPGGVVVVTNAPTFSEESASGGRVHSTEGLGAWASLGDGGYALRVVFLYFDAEEAPWGVLTLEGVLTLDPSGDRLEGTFDVAVVNAEGTSLFVVEGEPVSGARIRPRSDS